MRFPRLAMSLRSLMVLIVGIGIGMVLSDARRRWMHCKAMSGRIRLEAAQLRDELEDDKKKIQQNKVGYQVSKEQYANFVKAWEHEIEQLDALVRDFDRAAIVPWMPVPRNPFPSTIQVDYDWIGEPAETTRLIPFAPAYAPPLNLRPINESPPPYREWTPTPVGAGDRRKAD